VADRSRLLRLGYVILKAFSKRSIAKKRQAVNSENQVERAKRKTLRKCLQAMRRFAASQRYWVQQVQRRFQLMTKQNRIRDLHRYTELKRYLRFKEMRQQASLFQALVDYKALQTENYQRAARTYRRRLL